MQSPVHPFIYPFSLDEIHIDDMIIPFYPIHEGHRHSPLFSAILFFFARLVIIERRLGFCLINQDFVESSEVCEDDCTSILPCISGSLFKVFVVLSCLVICILLPCCHDLDLCCGMPI